MSGSSDKLYGAIKKITLANRLKARLGAKYEGQQEGFLSPEVIAKADALIASMCTSCPVAIGEIISRLSACWEKIKKTEIPTTRADLMSEMFTHAHEIKDVGSLCGFELISHFAESLRDYIASAELDVEAKLIIIQAHLDAIQIVHRQGIKQNAGPEAEELKRMVSRAVDQYR